MTIDERLEALAQTVELMALMQRDNERRFQNQFDKVAEQFSQHEQLFGQVALRLREVSDDIHEVTSTVHKVTITVREVTITVREMSDSIDSLARIAGVHQERLDGHERRLGDLEQRPPA